MAQTNNGGLWKGATAVMGLLLTASLVVAAANRDWGSQKEKVSTLESTVGKHSVQIECHDREIATLKANLSNVLERLRETNEKLDEILRRIPPGVIATRGETRSTAEGGS